MRTIDRASGHPPPAILAAALDLGTTTLSLQLLDLTRPAILGTAVAENPQVRYGDDILSRIAMASRPAGLAALRGAAIGAVNALLESLRGETGAADQVYGMVVAANPAMASIFAGEDPSTTVRAGRLPSPLAAGSMGLALHPRAPVRILSPLSQFIGGDVAAGLVHAGLLSGRKKSFYIDLGTNGEMVLRAGARLFAASAAAGPALEGRRISCGMRAGEGAIDSVSVTADVSFGVIGGGEPGGMCGSGLLELLAGLISAGIVRPDGRFADEEEASLMPRPRLIRRLRGRGEHRRFVVAEPAGGEISLTQGDVRELQLAKGAIRAGVEILLREAGARAGEVERVVVAGTFGYHLSARSLISAGFLPPEWLSAVEFAGNASLAGAREYLLFATARRRIGEIARRTRTIDLAPHPRFRETFLASLIF